MNTFFPEMKKKLGFGCMRFPMNGDQVDLSACSDMVDAFLAAGFNYFDTAHGYLGGASEKAVKACLTSRYPRDRYLLTDKLSGSFFASEADIRPYFDAMLEACGVEYFDFFLMHSQNARNYEKFKACRAYEIASELKAEGKVRHVGFSFHDTADVLDRILTEQPQIEVVQLQFNYLDYEDLQVQSRLCYEVCEKHGKPVIVMEPVRGGSLVNLSPEALQIFDDLHGCSPAGYAIRYAASFDNICMVLSGMSNREQMEDNISFMKDFHPLSKAEYRAVEQVTELIRAIPTIPCTGCRYCEEGCPEKIDIPGLMSAENKARRFGTDGARGSYAFALDKSGHPYACVKCGKCERICPQHLEIRSLIRQIADRFEK